MRSARGSGSPYCGAAEEWVKGHYAFPFGSNPMLYRGAADYIYASTGAFNGVPTAALGVSRLELGLGAKIFNGAGTPEGSQTAPIGSMYLRSDGGAGTTLYIKESGAGNTGWIAK